MRGLFRQSHAPSDVDSRAIDGLAFASIVSFSSNRLLKEEDGEIDFQPSYERALEDQDG